MFVLLACKAVRTVSLCRDTLNSKSAVLIQDLLTTQTHKTTKLCLSNCKSHWCYKMHENSHNQKFITKWELKSVVLLREQFHVHYHCLHSLNSQTQHSLFKSLPRIRVRKETCGGSINRPTLNWLWRIGGIIRTNTEITVANKRHRVV